MRRYWQNMLSSKTVVAALILGFLALMGVVAQSCASRSELAQRHASLTGERDALERENSRLLADVTRLHTELSPFRTVALQRYGSMDTAAMAALATNLLSVQRELAAIRETVQSVDSRTGFIRSLPDGRTMMGDFITGEPTVLVTLAAHAVDAYNSQRFDRAINAASDFVARYEETQAQAKKGIGLYNTNWSLMAGTMYGILAEKALSEGNYDLALAHADKATQMQPLTFNDVVKTVILITQQDVDAATQMLTSYMVKPPESRSEFFRTLDKMGYLGGTNLAALLKGNGISVDLRGPPAMSILLPMGTYTNFEEFAMLWVGLGNQRPVFLRRGRLE